MKEAGSIYLKFCRIRCSVGLQCIPFVEAPNSPGSTESRKIICFLWKQAVKCVFVSAKRPETVPCGKIWQGSTRQDMIFYVKWCPRGREPPQALPPFLLPPKRRGPGQGRNLAKRCLKFLASLAPSAIVRLLSTVYQWYRNLRLRKSTQYLLLYPFKPWAQCWVL